MSAPNDAAEGESAGTLGVVTVDCRGMRCPRPVVELARAASRLESGELLLLADDPATEVDVPAWCRLRGASLVASGRDLSRDESRDATLRWFRVAVG